MRKPYAFAAMSTQPSAVTGIRPSLFAFAIFYGGMVCIAGVLGNKQVALGPLAVEAILRTLHETDGMEERDALSYEEPYGTAVFATDDAKEGPRAFAEKRAPNFQRR